MPPSKKRRRVSGRPSSSRIPRVAVTTSGSEDEFASYDWKLYLKENPDTVGAPPSTFPHVPLPNGWSSIEGREGLMVEVRLPKEELAADLPNGRKAYFWFGNIQKFCGLMAKVQLEGGQYILEEDVRESVSCRWNVITASRNVGFARTQSSCEILPPKFLKRAEIKKINWFDSVYDKLCLNETIPRDLWMLPEHNYENYSVGMTVEVLDTSCLSRMKVGKVIELLAGRVHVRFWDSNLTSDLFDFACHAKSERIRPSGWSKTVGLEVSAPYDYDDIMLEDSVMEELCANSNSSPKIKGPIKVGMRLEAVDLNRRAMFTSAVVKKVLKHGYILVGNNHCEENLSEEPVCYHISSPMLFPCGFSEDWGIPLALPHDYKGQKENFAWNKYTKQKKCLALNFTETRDDDAVNHGFKVGMKLEAMDLLEGDMICPATVKGVYGRLLQLSFDGWGAEYDTWVDAESPELYPVGWCELNKYLLRYPGGVQDYWNDTMSNDEEPAEA